MRILVTGSSGFIGHHLCNYLKSQGHFVRAVDWKAPEHDFNCNEFHILDLRDFENCVKMTAGMDQVYQLAADMGGMGFIQDTKNQARILRNNALINIHMIEASRINDINEYLYSSSACIYPEYKQTKTDSPPLKESDAYPAMPQDTYGWEKLVAEILTKAYEESYGMKVRIFRFHNIYGPEGSWNDGREKAPAALCRKVAMAKKNKENSVEIWGDGLQRRSFCYIDDCLKALDLVMNGNNSEPINVGRNDSIGINEMAQLISKIAEYPVSLEHIEGPQGVRGRNSDNTKFKEIYGWVPGIDMKTGLTKTYQWITNQINQ